MKMKLLIFVTFIVLNLILFLVLGSVSFYALPIQIFIILLFTFRNKFEKDLSNKKKNDNYYISGRAKYRFWLLQYKHVSTIWVSLFEETLTAASFQEDSSVPDLLFSIPLNEDEGDESIEDARGKLLSLFDLEN